MADAIWGTVEMYGLEGRVCRSVFISFVTPSLCPQILAFVMDNASNNDTMVQHFKEKCEERDIDFDADEARIRCMPHTVHLAALKVEYNN
jgi:hypothetical protein